MNIEVENLSKRFNRELIFQKLTFTFEDNNKYVITGPNGSGKSTLLQILSGATIPSGGSLQYCILKNRIALEHVFKHISFAAPYLELIEEFTLNEMVNFHFKFKRIKRGEDKDSVIKKAMFEGQEHKTIKNFSSGMKQRLKLALAFYSDTNLLLMDEPTSNLDERGVAWYDNQMKSQNERLVILASNIQHEYHQFDHEISILNYK